MARRSRKSLFGGSLRRSFNTLTRATLRQGSRQVVRAVKKASTQIAKAASKRVARQRVPTSTQGEWVAGLASGVAGLRRYRLFKPSAAIRQPARPLLVMLHGCGQDAAGFARSTRLQALAAREGFLLIYPEQERLANPQGCWNWFDTRSGRAFSEAASILAAVDQVCLLHGADPQRVAVAGFSAGAGMAALLALRHPERFRAVVMHSGVAPGAAHSTATAIAAMQGRRRPAPLPDDAGRPPLLVIQGTADPVVAASNGLAAAQSWVAATQARAGIPRHVQRGKRRAMTVTDFKRAGRTLATLCEVDGLGHAWSGGASAQSFSDPTGPDAGRLAWAFVARCFAQVV